MVERYQVFKHSLTQLEMDSAFPDSYHKVVLASDYDAVAAELARCRAANVYDGNAHRKVAQFEAALTKVHGMAVRRELPGAIALVAAEALNPPMPTAPETAAEAHERLQREQGIRSGSVKEAVSSMDYGGGPFDENGREGPNSAQETPANSWYCTCGRKNTGLMAICECGATLTASETKDKCVKCGIPLPPLEQWSMPACPACTAKAETPVEPTLSQRMRAKGYSKSSPSNTGEMPGTNDPETKGKCNCGAKESGAHDPECASRYSACEHVWVPAGLGECCDKCHIHSSQVQTIAKPDDPNAPFRWICLHCSTVSGIDDKICLGCKKPRYPKLAAQEMTAKSDCSCEGIDSDTGLHTSTCVSRMREYRFDRFRNGRQMAQGAIVNAITEDEALAKAHALFRECPHDTFTLKTKGDHG